MIEAAGGTVAMEAKYANTTGLKIFEISVTQE